MFALAFVLLTSASAPNAAAQAQLDRGKAAIEELEYGVAAEEFMAVATNRKASDAQKLEANLLAGVVQRVLGSNVEAKLHFMYVFARDPEAKLPPGQPPKVTGFFELVREEAIALNQLRAAQNRDPMPAPTTTSPPTEVSPKPVPGLPSEPATEIVESTAAPATTTTATAETPELPSEALSPPTEADAATSPPPSGFSPLLVGGLGGLGLGVGLALIGLTGGVASDFAFVTPTLSTDIRKTAQVTSAVSWGTVVLGVVVVGAGVAATAMGALE